MYCFHKALVVFHGIASATCRRLRFKGTFKVASMEVSNFLDCIDVSYLIAYIPRP